MSVHVNTAPSVSLLILSSSLHGCQGQGKLVHRLLGLHAILSSEHLRVYTMSIGKEADLVD